jgi:hypothetical protein
MHRVFVTGSFSLAVGICPALHLMGEALSNVLPFLLWNQIMVTGLHLDLAT